MSGRLYLSDDKKTSICLIETWRVLKTMWKYVKFLVHPIVQPPFYPPSKVRIFWVTFRMQDMDCFPGSGTILQSA